MFDANARYLPDGELFFAECHSIDHNSYILSRSLKEGNIYLCEKVSNDPHKCKFRIFLDDTKEDYLTVGENLHNEENFDYDSLFVYSGCPDGNGFINNDWKQKALDFLGGQWYA